MELTTKEQVGQVENTDLSSEQIGHQGCAWSEIGGKTRQILRPTLSQEYQGWAARQSSFVLSLRLGVLECPVLAIR